MGRPASVDDAAERKLSPSMRSRKLQALDFIKRYFAEWGHSPSLDEIGAALGVSKQRAADLVRKLSIERQITVVSGKVRGISLPDRSEEISEADALLRLRRLGWILPGDSPAVRGLTETGLTDLPELDHQ